MLQVTSDFGLALAAIFSVPWRIITSVSIPGTNINVAEFLLAVSVICIVLKYAPRLFGGDSFGGGDDK